MGNQIDSFDFEQYISDKYKDRIVHGAFDNPVQVKDICDLRFEHLDIEDQKLALNPAIGYGWGLANSTSIESSTEFKGYLFNPKVRTWWHRPERYPLLMGAFGSSKTTPAELKCLDNCIKYPGTRGLIMRETYRQLIDTNIATLFKIFRFLGWREDHEYLHHKTDKKIILNLDKGHKSEILYRPAKEEGQTLDEIIADLQSLEIDFALLSEVCGIDYKIFLALQGRIGRWGTITNESRQQLMCEGNPPDEGHWVDCTWFKQTLYDPHSRDTKPLTDPENYYVISSSAESNRINLHPKYLETLRNYPPALRRKFYEGKIGYMPPDGIPVYDNYNHDWHTAKECICEDVDVKKPLGFGFDIGPTGKYKALCIAQVNAVGRLDVYHEFLFDGAGLHKFFQLCQLELKSRFPDNRLHFDWADPKCNDKSDTDLKSPAIIGRRYGFNLRAGETRLDMRLAAVDSWLTKSIKGGPALRICPRHCKMLIKGFRGSYRYQDITSSSVESMDGMISPRPIKNIFSHLHDALQYLCSRLDEVSHEDRMAKRERIRRRNPNVFRRDKYRADSIRKLRGGRNYTSI